MKKMILLLVLIAVSATGVTGQKKVSGGLRFGINASNLSEGGDSQDIKVGPLVGGYLSLKAAYRFSIQPELHFSSMGANVSSFKFKLMYVDVPILFRLNLGKMVNLHAGPEIGLLLSAKGDDVDIKQFFEPVDISIVSGIGIDLPFGLNFNARYNLGVSNVGEGVGGGLNDAVRNTAFQLMAGYTLFGK